MSKKYQDPLTIQARLLKKCAVQYYMALGVSVASSTEMGIFALCGCFGRHSVALAIAIFDISLRCFIPVLHVSTATTGLHIFSFFQGRIMLQIHRYSILDVQDEVRTLVESGKADRHQPLYSLCQYFADREWLNVEQVLEDNGYLLRDQIWDLLPSERWSND